MIILTKLGKEEKKFVLNAELIETIEEIPETLILLINGKKIMVKEKKEEIIKEVVKYKKSIII